MPPEDEHDIGYGKPFHGVSLVFFYGKLVSMIADHVKLEIEKGAIDGVPELNKAGGYFDAMADIRHKGMSVA
jgi:hypothetical protein